jgi:hypothetical protein
MVVCYVQWSIVVLHNKIARNLHPMQQRLETGICLIFLLLSTFLIASRLFSVGPLVQRVVDVNEITAGTNLDYSVSRVFQPKFPLYGAGVASDSLSFPWQSTLQLYEDGKELGPVHSLHDDIRNIGGGRYSHWGNALGNGYIIFSTSDNTDPRSNGRTYSIRFIAVPGLLLFGLAIAVWFLSFVRLYWISDRCRRAAAIILGAINNHSLWRATVLLACLYLCYVLLWLFPRTPILSPDSSTYLLLSPLRGIGYPAFVFGVNAVTGSLLWLSAAQLLVFIGAVIYLYVGAERLFRWPFLAGFLALSLLTYGPVTETMLWLLSEPLFIALIVIIIGAIFHALSNPGANLPLCVLAAGTAALIFVRPAGYFVFGVAPFLAIAWRSQFRRVVVWAIVPMAVLVILGMGVSNLIHGIPTQAIGGYALFPHVAHLFEARFVTPDKMKIATAVEVVTRPYADKLAAQPDWRARYQFSTNASGPIRDTVTGIILNNWVDADDVPNSVRDVIKTWLEKGAPAPLYKLDKELVTPLNNEFQQLATATILGRPFGYLDVVLLHAAAAWDFNILAPHQPMPIAVLDEYKAQEKNARRIIGVTGIDLVPWDADWLAEQYPVLKRQNVTFVDATSNLLIDKRYIASTVGVIGLMAIPIAIFFRRSSSTWLALGSVGTIMHGAVFLVAAATVFDSRYALPIDVMVITGLMLACDMGLAWLQSSGMVLMRQAFALRRQPFIHRGTGPRIASLSERTKISVAASSSQGKT